MKYPVVLKFGGASVGSPERFRRAVQVVQRLMADRHRVVVVASALSGVTNKLVALSDHTLPIDVCHAHMDWLQERHQLHAAEVLSLRAQRIYNIELQQQLAALEVYVLNRTDSRARKDMLLAAGERLSHHILALALDDAGLSMKVVDWQKAAGLVGQFILVIRGVLYVAILIIFVVAVVIINNSMVMATMERVTEIGTMRAIGAGRRLVLIMFMLETMVLGGLAGLLGAYLPVLLRRDEHGSHRYLWRLREKLCRIPEPQPFLQ